MKSVWIRYVERGYDSRRVPECTVMLLVMLGTAWAVGPVWYFLLIMAFKAVLNWAFSSRWTWSPDSRMKSARLALAWPIFLLLSIPIIMNEEQIRSAHMVRSVMED